MARRSRRSVKGVIPAALGWLIRGARFLITPPSWLVTLAVAGGCAYATWAMVRVSPAFRVVSVHLPPKSTLRLPEGLIGTNLWAVDMAALGETLNAQQPHLKQVRVTRVPPSSLRIDIRERAPVAQVQVGSWHPIDEDGFVLPQSSPTPLDGLVVLKGVSDSNAPLKVGRAHEGERLQRALRVARLLAGSPLLRGQRIRSIDAGDPKQLRFTLDGDVEIRCGSEPELAMQLKRLRAALETVWQNQVPVRYIDVRFPDPVIGPRV
jgi:hypothetical protein